MSDPTFLLDGQAPRCCPEPLWKLRARTIGAAMNGNLNGFHLERISGLVAHYQPDSTLNILNGSGISQLTNLAPDDGLENWLVWSEDFSQASWSVYLSTSKVGVAVGVGPNGEDAMEISFGATPTSALFQSVSDINGASQSWLVRSVAGTTTIRLSVVVGGVDTYTSDISIGTTWALISQGPLNLSGSPNIALRNNTANNSGNIYVLRAQLRRATKSPTYKATQAIRYVYEDRNLLQATAASQPLLSRNDGSGNLLLRSEEFQTAWGRTFLNTFGATDTGVAGAGSFANTTRTTDPIGGNTADFIQEDTNNNQHYIAQNGLSLTGAYIFSVYVKPAGRTWCYIQTGPHYGWVNLSTKAIGTASGISIITEDAGNGWVKCSGTSTEAGATSVIVGLSPGNGVASYAGDNTSGLFLWGASLRPSSWSPTYVPTTSYPVFPGLNGRKVAVFDGVDDYLKTLTFPLVQPTEVFVVVRQDVWTKDHAWFDGFTDGTAQIYGRGVSPALTLYAGLNGPDSTDFTVGEWAIATIVVNGVSSSLTKNQLSPATGNAGAANMNGLTLGAGGSNLGNYPISAGDLLIFNRVLSAEERAYIITSLARIYGITL